MRLLKIDQSCELSLTNNIITDLPPYAILSHIWGPDQDEISFDDLGSLDYKNKAGFAKLKFCADQARKDGLQYFWVDTCCIKKSDSSELSEAIVSMFRWYCQAEKCYVYLSDVPNLKRSHGESHAQLTEEEAFRSSRWFTRGWTLQELLAPRTVEFFSRENKFLGTRTTRAKSIEEITDIPARALLLQEQLTSFGVQERMSWVRNRKTTRPEDKSYCMLGIFDVSIPIVYGEGKHASAALTRAIADRFRDHELAGLEQYLSNDDLSRGRRHDNAKPHAALALQERCKILLSSLYFEQMDVRRSTIKKEFVSTCSWILQHPIYREWTDLNKIAHHHGFLWLRGKPGSGKSTMMKFAHASCTRQKCRNEILVSFFFNARGYRMEKTKIGLYRSLLFQLLQKAPDLYHVIDDLHDTTISIDHLYRKTDSLCDLITEVVLALGDRSLKCFIDALDECGEQQVREIINFFEDLGQRALQVGVRIHICFASRHYPAIDLSHGLRLNLENEYEHGEDLRKYINNYLRAGTGGIIEDFRTRVKEKAKGVFMWAVLVVDILNKEFERGYIPAVEKRLNDLPPELSDLFGDIVQRDSHNMRDFRLCLMWTLFARRPLRREEYYSAMIAGLDPVTSSTLKSDTIDEDYMNRYVLSSSKGLAELTREANPTVQFIHESVRDFLMRDGGVSKIWHEIEPDHESLESKCHNQLRQCCEIYVTSDESSVIFDRELLSKTNSAERMALLERMRTQRPFLDYATQNMFYHADEAAEATCQLSFLERLPFKTWVRAHNFMSRYQNHRYTPEVTYPYVFADNNLARLLRAVNGREAAFRSSAERYQYPIMAALAKEHVDAAHALLPHCDKEMLRRAIAESHIKRSISLPKDQTPFTWAVLSGHSALVRIFLESPDCILPQEEYEWSELLYNAADKNYIKIARLLLHRVADVDAVGGKYGSALHVACMRGFVELAKALLDHGADVNKVGSYGNAFHIACEFAPADTGLSRLLLDRVADVTAGRGAYSADNTLAVMCGRGDVEIVNLMLDKAATLDGEGWSHGDALKAACSKGNITLVRLLLDRGSDVARLIDDCSALYIAADGGSNEVVRLLLEKGANVNAAGFCQRSPLKAASGRGHAATVKCLLENGADIFPRGKRNGSALNAACHEGHFGIASLLLTSAYAAHSLSRTRFDEALYIASGAGHVKIVALLLDHGIDAKGEFDRRCLTKPLWIASRQGHVTVVELLLNKGADVKEIANLLYAACCGGHVETARLLLQRAADISALSLHAALTAAQREGHSEMVRLLVEHGAKG